jgi:hypothetical protein
MHETLEISESVKLCWHSWLHYFTSWAIDLRLRQIQLEKFRNFMGLSLFQNSWILIT